MSNYIQRVGEAAIYNSFESPFITAIIGARRVGKSTLVREFAKQHPNYCWVFLNLDHRTQRVDIRHEKLRQMIEEAAEKNIGGNQKIWVMIDEAQKSEELFNQVKIIYDEFKDQHKIKFILTGSGQLTLRQHCAETLAGRIEIHDLREFSLHEATLIKRPDLKLPKNSILEAIFNEESPQQIEQYLSELSPLRGVYEKILQEELVWGGLPECLKNICANLSRTTKPHVDFMFTTVHLITTKRKKLFTCLFRLYIKPKHKEDLNGSLLLKHE